MKAKYGMRMLVCLAVLTAALFCMSCSSDETDTPAVESVNISISIDYPEKAKLPDLKTLPFRIEEETSVLQAIELYGSVNNTSDLVETTYSTLEGIDGVVNGITLKSGEWKYQINGKELTKPMGDVILKDGDHLEFIYTKVKTEA